VCLSQFSWGCHGAQILKQWGTGMWERMLIMVSLWNRAEHYIFILWFLSIYLLSSSFFPPLISAAAHGCLSYCKGLTVLVYFYFPLSLHHYCCIIRASLWQETRCFGNDVRGRFMFWCLELRSIKCCVAHLPTSDTPSVITRTVWPRCYLGRD